MLAYTEARVRKVMSSGLSLYSVGLEGEERVKNENKDKKENQKTK